MRIVAWNANYNNRRRSFEADAELLYSEGADLIVLSETARPVVEFVNRIAWLGTQGHGH